MEKRTSDREYLLFGARIVGDFGVTIAVPVVIFALAGKALDTRWRTAPWMLILGFLLAAVLSGISITRKAKAYGRQYQTLVDNEKPQAPESSTNAR